MAKNIPKPSDGRCSVCGIANKRLYLYNDTKVYNRDSKNYQWRRSRNTCSKPIERGALDPATIAQIVGRNGHTQIFNLIINEAECKN